MSRKQRASRKTKQETTICDQHTQQEMAVPKKVLGLQSMRQWDFSKIVEKSKKGNCCLFYSLFLAVDIQEKWVLSGGNFEKPEQFFMDFQLKYRKKTGGQGYTEHDMEAFLSHLQKCRMIREYTWKKLEEVSHELYPNYLFPVTAPKKKRDEIIVLFGRGSDSQEYKKLTKKLNSTVTERLDWMQYKVMKKKLRARRRSHRGRRRRGWLNPLKKDLELVSRSQVESSVIVRNFNLVTLLKMRTHGFVHAVSVKFHPASEHPLLCDNKYNGKLHPLSFLKLGQSVNSVNRMYRFHLRIK